MNNKINVGNMIKALTFMEKAHHGQMLKDGSMPYIEHPMAVFTICLKYAEDDLDFDCLASLCLLHDVIEDTFVTVDDLKAEFGERVAEGVGALSKKDDLHGFEAIKDSIERILSQPKEVAVVKLADRIHNLRNVPQEWNSAKRAGYKKESEYLFEKLSFASPELAKLLKERITNYFDFHIDHSI